MGYGELPNSTLRASLISMLEVEFCSRHGPDELLLEAHPHLGPNTSLPTVPEGSVPSGELSARIHDLPIAFSLRDTADGAKAKLVAKLYQRHDLWLVPHRFSVTRVSGHSSIVTLGCEIAYADTDQTFSII